MNLVNVAALLLCGCATVASALVRPYLFQSSRFLLPRDATTKHFMSLFLAVVSRTRLPLCVVRAIVATLRTCSRVTTTARATLTVDVQCTNLLQAIFENDLGQLASAVTSVLVRFPYLLLTSVSPQQFFVEAFRESAQPSARESNPLLSP
jgi:hypothetical protein